MTRMEIEVELRKLAIDAPIYNIDDKINEQFGLHRKIYVYGAGFCGKTITEFLFSYNGGKYKPTYLLDKNANEKTEYMGVPVYKPDDENLTVAFKESALVILAVWLPLRSDFDHLRDYLFTRGYRHIVYPHSMVWRAIVACISEEAFNRDIYSSNINDVIAAYELMADKVSEDTFLYVFRSHTKSDYEVFNNEIPGQCTDLIQYFDPSVPRKKHINTCIDCGAYKGELLDALGDYYEIEKYIGFEPNPANYNILSETANMHSSRIKDIVILPLGVSDQNGFLGFDLDGINSRICETSEDVIQTVKLDDVFKGSNDLAIKIDIEGAELRALHGAKRIITETKPDLMISVYHRISDLWRIPLLLKKWVPEYRFYLRAYSNSTIDTVLHAIT